MSLETVLTCAQHCVVDLNEHREIDSSLFGFLEAGQFDHEELCDLSHLERAVRSLAEHGRL